MKFNLNKKIKIFLIAVLTILVVGMTMLGVLGFNQTIDNRASYRMEVSVDQITDKSVEILKTSSEKALADLGIADYKVLEKGEGSTIVYKFNYDVTSKATAVKDAVQSALDAGELVGFGAEVSVYENLGNFATQTGNVIIAISVAIVLILAYALVMNKLSAGVATLCSSTLSVLFFSALMAITRIPSQPYFAILACCAVVLSSVLSLVITTKYKALAKNSKASAQEISQTAHDSLRAIYIIMLVCVALAGIIVSAIGGLSLIFLGLGIIVAGLAGVISAVYMTPFMYTIVKNVKK